MSGVKRVCRVECDIIRCKNAICICRKPARRPIDRVKDNRTLGSLLNAEDGQGDGEKRSDFFSFCMLLVSKCLPILSGRNRIFAIFISFYSPPLRWHAFFAVLEAPP